MENNMMGLQLWVLQTVQISILKIKYFFDLKCEQSHKKLHEIHFLGDGMYACLPSLLPMRLLTFAASVTAGY